jgi:hypothetical protein
VTGTAVVTRRCNPYGHETGGPRHLLGGMYGPEYEGDKYKWTCERRAEGRYRMTCRCGHRGQEMWLCGPGTETGTSSEGATTWHHPGHVAEIQKRASDSCPKCLYPEEARMWAEVAERSQMELAYLEQIPGYVLSPQARSLRRQLDGARTRLDELNATGAVHKCPLTLTEVS